MGSGQAAGSVRGTGYADKYRHLAEPVDLVALEFSAETRNVMGFEAELA